MCGIVGYTGGGRAAEIIYSGLKQLEYRGYDSAGIATLCGGAFNVAKMRGRVRSLEHSLPSLRGNTAIGHTRWATHGQPSDINAHPHTCGKFTLVHNGIIENFAALKEKYFPGERFLSDTDSEIIVRLLDKFYDGDFPFTLKRVADMLTGSYALMVMCTDFNGFAVVKYRSPAIIGYGRGGNFAASDAPALAGTCGEISVLDDGDIALVTDEEVVVFNGDMQSVIRERLKNLAVPADLELGGYSHYMLKEINETPASVVNTAAAFLGAEGGLIDAVSGAERVIIVGCGTAYNSGLAAKRFVEELARIPAEAEIAGEFRYKRPIVTRNTLVVAVSQSGETADTVEAAKLSKTLGARVIAVTNAPYSALTRVADFVVPVAAGCEICVAATKSYTGQIAALYLLATALAGGDIKRAAKELTDMRPLIQNTLENADMCAVEDMCLRSRGVYFLGRDVDYAVALEGSLKLKEVSYIAGEGYPAGELKHGTLALIDGQTTAVVLITRADLAQKSVNAVEQVLSRGGKVAVISNVGGIEAELKGRAHLVKIPPCDPLLSPLLTAVCVQKLAYGAAVKLGRDPDKPRNLAKSVTVE